MKKTFGFIMLAGILAFASCKKEETTDTHATDEKVIGDSTAIIVDTAASAPVETLPAHKH